jgi:hypothetical protein
MGRGQEGVGAGRDMNGVDFSRGMRGRGWCAGMTNVYELFSSRSIELGNASC